MSSYKLGSESGDWVKRNASTSTDFVLYGLLTSGEREKRISKRKFKDEILAWSGTTIFAMQDVLKMALEVEFVDEDTTTEKMEKNQSHRCDMGKYYGNRRAAISQRPETPGARRS